jgi:hypothetical protein
MEYISMDFKLFVDSLLTGTPLAILAALVGVIWQALYVRSRDRLHDEQIRREMDIERRKFEHQKELEVLRFEYEQRRWREELARDITVKIVESRIEEYSKVWSYIESVAKFHFDMGNFTIDSARKVAQNLKDWRYGKGGLLAEATTREATYTLQTALFKYDETKESFKSIRRARSIFRDALRADIGLGENVKGQTIFESIEERQKIRNELAELQSKLGIDFQE